MVPIKTRCLLFLIFAFFPKHLYDQSTNAQAVSTAGKLLFTFITAPIPYLLM